MQKLMLPIAGAVTALILAGAIFVSVRPQAAHVSPAMFAVDGTDIGGPFELTAHTGERVTSADVIDGPTLVYFGYTFCPDVCPLDTVRNAEAADLLTGQGYDVQTVFISVDPNRDTPEVLQAFTEIIHPDMIGLTGTPEQTHAAAQAYRVYYNSHDDGTDPYYLVDHTAFTYLMMPEIGFVDFFHRDVAPDEMATRTACFADAAA